MANYYLQAMPSTAKVQIFSFSAECDNYSGLANRKRDLAAFQNEAPSKSGSTMRAGLKYVRIAEPLMVCNENVKNIATQVDGTRYSDLTAIQHDYADMGYVMWHQLLKTQMYRCHQVRPRVFTLMVLLLRLRQCCALR